MRSYRVHACNPETNGKIPYLILSLCGTNRVSIDMTAMQEPSTKPLGAFVLTMEALYDLLQGKSITLDQRDGELTLLGEHAQLIIFRQGVAQAQKFWMSELALAWNMLAGSGMRRFSHDAKRQ